MSELDARAMISPKAKLGAGVRVAAFAVVGDDVELGEGCVLASHAVVRGPRHPATATHNPSNSPRGTDWPSRRQRDGIVKMLPFVPLAAHHGVRKATGPKPVK